MNKSLLEYMHKSSKGAKSKHKERIFLDNIYVFIKDEIIGNVNIDNVLLKIKKHVPLYLFNGIDAIYIGQFKELQEKQVNAAYMDGALYVTNVQEDEQNMLEDIVHEIAHSIEDLANFSMYNSDKVPDEFIAKRLKLQKILESKGYNTQKFNFTRLEYDEQFDKYLYEVVGYPALHSMTVGIFCSPYGATSLREYFANGFEYYFVKDRQLVKKISPQLFKLLIEVEKGEFNETDTDDLSY